MTSNDWFNQGKEHIWHPYTQMHTAPLPQKVVKTEGVYIELEDGRKLIDGVSSWWSVCHGHNHPHIREAIIKQTEQFPHVMFAGLAHEPAYTLAARLAKLAPQGLNRVFFSDSGSTAVEVAMKMAAQYWYNKGQKGRTKFVSFRHGYHGDTMGTMSLCDPEGMHKRFDHFMPRQYVVDIPRGEYAFAEFDEILGSVKKTIAAVVIEPLVQGAGGMIFHSADMLAEIHRICKKHDILFIADEIMTGFGRTGLMFACEEADITPDIMCLSKALTGGTVGLGATLATDEIFEAFLSDDMEKAFMHGPTFMANPVACAAANASLDIFEKEKIIDRIAEIEMAMWQSLSPLMEKTKVKDVRVKGAIGVVQLEATGEDMLYFRGEFLKRNIWLRPFNGVIYIMPPFSITDRELVTITDAVKEVVGNWLAEVMERVSP